MTLAAVRRDFEAVHEELKWHDGTRTSWTQERDDAHPYRYDEGAGIWLSREDLTPDSEFLTPIDQRKIRLRKR